MYEKLNAVNEPLVNVRESYPIYDTVIVSPVMYGSEDQNKGWFTTFAAFAAQSSHSFFKTRTQATAGLCYCNKEAVDAMDFPMRVFSIGVAFFAPGVRVLSEPETGEEGNDEVTQMNSQFAHWWETVLPSHCSLEFKVQQDVIMEMPALACPPGYGPMASGASFEHDMIGYISPDGLTNQAYLPVLNFGVTQGVPTIRNRWPLAVRDQHERLMPLEIPRTGSIEAILRISDMALHEMRTFTFNPYYFFNSLRGNPDQQYHFPARFGIQVSLLGERLVQQRGQYFDKA